MSASFLQQVRYLLYRNILIKLRKPSQTIMEILFPIYAVLILVILAIFIPSGPLQPVLDFPSYPLRLAADFRSLPNIGSVIAFSPNTSEYSQIMTKVASRLAWVTPIPDVGNRKVLGFETEEQVERYFYDNPQTIRAAVHFENGQKEQLNKYNNFEWMGNFGDTEVKELEGFQNSLPNGHKGFHVQIKDVKDETRIQVKIRMNSTISAPTSSVQASETFCRVSETTGVCQADYYYSSGFLALQEALEIALFENQLGFYDNRSSISFDVNVKRLPKPLYITSNGFLSSFSAIYVVIAFAPLVQYLLTNIVAEKESKIKEGMLMMGLRNSALIVSWFLTYGLLVLISSLVMAFMCVYGSVVPSASLFIIFFMFSLYGLSSIAYSFIIITFFDKPKVAGAVGSFITIIIGLIYFPLNYIEPGPSSSVKWACSLLSPLSLALGFGEAVYLESLGMGATLDTIFEGFMTPGYSISSSILMMILDTVFYLILAWYLDSVVPSEYGAKLSPWFCFTPSFWRPRLSSKIKMEHDEGFLDENIEPVSEEMKNRSGIQIRGVSKEFSKTRFFKKVESVKAVNNVNLDMYEGQIFGLLGHNGAGKTTLVSILSGLYSSFQGNVKILGKDVSTQIGEIRKSMGVCPQQNILFDNLTVKEHLTIYAGIKGIKPSDIELEVKKIANQVDLDEQFLKKANSLSGGQKRKLCVGMALIGNPKIIFLDEPTAGMDPYSRRKLWDLLQTSKKDKVILLTTHFMDEADFLADRKAILNKGKVRCVGSSLFLKNRFGIGYYLNVLHTNGNIDEIKNSVLEEIQGSKINKLAGNEISFVLPLEEIPSFKYAFERLDTMKSKKNIDSYSVSMTTLEEVFIRLENEQENETKEETVGFERPDSVIMGVDFSETHNTNLKPSPVGQYKALVLAKMQQSKRNIKGFFFTVVLPVYFVLIGLLVYTLIPLIGTSEPSLELVPSIYSRQLEKPVPFSNQTNEVIDDVLNNMEISFAERFSENFYSSFLPDGVDGTRDFAGVLFNQINFETETFEFDLYYNSSFTHSIPIMLHQLRSGYYNQILKNQNLPELKIEFVNHPLTYKSINFNANDFIALLMIATALNIVAALFAVEVVKEREKSIKHQMMVMGVPLHIYWSATFTRDFLFYLIPTSLIFILIWAFSLDNLTGIAFFPFVLLVAPYLVSMILFCYCLSYLFKSHEVCLSYLPSFLNFFSSLPYYVVFTLDASGYRDTAKIVHYVMLIINPGYSIFGGIYFINVIGVLGDISLQPPTLEDYFKWDNMVLPTILVVIADIFIFSVILYFVDFMKNIRNVKPQEWPEKERKEKDQQNVLEDDSEVLKERALIKDDQNHPIRVQNLRKTFYSEERLPDEEKTFWKSSKNIEKAAVDDLCFGVKEGVCFGLLGPNGAGKTTTMSMLTCEFLPTYGTAQINGHDICTNRKEVQLSLGFCPQFDALFDDLSVKEHLILYSKIKGVALKEVPLRVRYLIDLLSISEHENKPVSSLSGGTKRKLSFAISIIGSPPVLILDEPSTGMDPSTRRHMWDIIIETKEGRATILTTHSMEEADALCSRIGIMVKGKLKCLGSAQELKEKFGDGYILDIKTNSQSTAEVKEFVSVFFQGGQIIEEYEGRLQFKIVSSTISLTTAFSSIEQNKERLKIEDYSFSQTTLEQVFISFAKKQYEE